MLSKITPFHEHALQILKAFCSPCITKLPLNMNDRISSSHSSALCSNLVLIPVYTKGILHILKNMQFLFSLSKHGYPRIFSQQIPLLHPRVQKCLLVALMYLLLGHLPELGVVLHNPVEYNVDWNMFMAIQIVLFY